MSPVRKVDTGSAPNFRMPDPTPRRWGLPLVAAASALTMAGAVALSGLVLVQREADRRDAVRDAAVLSDVSSFITQFTSPDPFNANDYADGILARATGPFAAQFTERMNEIVVQVAQAEPTKGTVEAVGIERWNDDGSADLVAAARTTTKLPDGTKIDSGNRWVLTATKEEGQWKISSLLQVI
jgi:Mce-associated membrane protein